MRTFNTYLNEAKISRKNLDKTVNLFMRYLSKKTSLEYWIDPNMEDLKGGGKGLEVILTDNRSLRFNWIQGEIHSITMWNNWTPTSSKGDRTVLLNGLNVVQVAKKLVEIFKKKSYVGKQIQYPQPMYESENKMTISEAKNKRVKPEVFVTEMGKNVATWDQITDFAASKMYNIPGAIRNAPTSGKGLQKTWDLTGFITGKMDSNPVTLEEPDKVANNKERDIEPVELEVVKGDKLTIDIPDYQMPDNLAELLSAVDPSEMTDMEYINYLYRELETSLQSVALGYTNLLVLVGGPGLGKTFTAKTVLKKHGWSGPEAAPRSAKDLYRTLYINRHAGDIILMDDADDVMDNDVAVNMFKKAFNDGAERKVQFQGQGIVNVSKYSEKEKEEFMQSVDDKLSNPDVDSVKLPDEFVYNGSMIFISNKSKKDFNDAVLSRGEFVDMDLTIEQAFLRIEQILDQIPSRKGGKIDLSFEEKKEVLEVAKALFSKELKASLDKWNAAADHKAKQKKMMDPRMIKPTLRYVRDGLEYRYRAKMVSGFNWVASMKKSI